MNGRDAHPICNYCQAHRDPCIYKVFGPCKWLPNAAAEEENRQEAQEQEKMKSAVDLQQEVIQYDNQLVNTMMNPDSSHEHHVQGPSIDPFPGL